MPGKLFLHEKVHSEEQKAIKFQRNIPSHLVIISHFHLNATKDQIDAVYSFLKHDLIKNVQCANLY